MIETFLIIKEDIYTVDVINAVFVRRRFYWRGNIMFRSAVYVTNRSYWVPDCDVSCIGASRTLSLL